MKAKVGLYYFGRHRNSWGIWCYDYVNNETGSATANFIKDCSTFDEVIKEVYQLNGWGIPKSIVQKF